MRLYYYRSQLNFGDHLNTWIWERLLPGCFDDPDDGIVMTVIGTLLGRGVPDGRAVIVFGSGTSYDPPPDDLTGPRWHLMALRGPLTARFLGVDESRAITDGAFVLRALPEATPVAEAERHGVYYVPHQTTASYADWPEICRRAGVTYLDVRDDSSKLLDILRHAKLVLAEAMHAAIVCDLVRVPWVPMVSMSEINTFKWVDWLETVNLPYEPVVVPPITQRARLYDALSPYWGGDHFTASSQPAEILGRTAERIANRKNPRWRLRARTMVHSHRRVLDPTVRLGERLGAWRAERERRTDEAAELIRRAALQPGYLSDERVMMDRSDALLDRVGEVRKLYRRLAG